MPNHAASPCQNLHTANPQTQIQAMLYKTPKQAS